MIAMQEGQTQEETKGRNPEEWVSTAQAARVASENNGRLVGPKYLNRLVDLGKLHVWQVDGRTRLFNLAEIEELRVSSKRGRRPLVNPSENAQRQRKYRREHGSGPRSQSSGEGPGPSMCACGESISQPWCCARLSGGSRAGKLFAGA